MLPDPDEPVVHIYAEGKTEEDSKALEAELHAMVEEIMQTDVGYVPVAWTVRYAAAKPNVRGIERNRQGEFVLEANIYVDMLPHLYMIERA